MEIDEWLRRWGAQQRGRAGPAVADPLSHAEEYLSALARRRRARILTQAAVALAIVVGLAVFFLVRGTQPGTPTAGGALTSTAPVLGCGATPLPASSVGVRTTLTPGPTAATWTLTVTNGTGRTQVLDRKVDLVAVDGSGRIIAARPVESPSIAEQSLLPGRSWTGPVRPVAADCAAPLGPSVPTIRAGTYRFVATFGIDGHYVASNAVSIEVGPGGTFSPGPA